MTLIDREDLLQKEDLKRTSYVVCSAHFEDSSIKIIKHLKENALPTNQPNRSQAAQAKGKERPLSSIKIEEDSSSSDSESTSTGMNSKGKRKVTRLSDETEYVAVETQTNLPSAEEETLKRKLSNLTREWQLKRRKSVKEITKIKELLEENNLSSDDEIGRRFNKLIEIIMM